MRISVFGAGAWGTALAQAYTQHHDVTLWARSPSHVEDLQRDGCNQRYLPGVTLSPSLRFTADLAAAAIGADLHLVVTPLSGLRDTARALQQLQPGTPLIWACKGLEAGSARLPHEIIQEELGVDAACGVLTGPSFAAEVAQGLPAAISLAAADAAFAQQWVQHLHQPRLRLYANTDLVGCEIGGDIKNVMAIAAGVSDGMGFGLNARAALITRGLAEIARQCYTFHEAVKQHVLPLINIIYQKKKEKLGVDTLRPWDIDAEPEDIKPLHPFKTSDELIKKSIDCFTRLRPFFGDCLKKMKELKHLDLESRKGKAPGGYNCPLAESGAPFIFMNAAGQMHDVTTMLHECGHAVHSFLAHPLELNGFKEYPMEIAEVASMSMELMSMDECEIFFSDKNDLQRAKEHQLERVITIFPWIAIIDKFQHWIYENPSHTHEQRTDKWNKILQEFGDDVIDYSGLEE